MATTLDMTPIRKTGLDLKAAIIEGVKDTQGLVMSPLPDELLITAPQFDELVTDPEMAQMYESNNYLYVTPLNAMEVRVKENTYDKEAL